MSIRKVRVLFVNTRSSLGADVAVHLSLIRSFDPDRVEPWIATNRHAPDLTRLLENLGALPADRIRICSLGAELPRGNPLALPTPAVRNLVALGSLARLARLVRRKRIDVLHSTDRPRDALFTGLLARMTGRPHILHLHLKWTPRIGRATHWALRRCAAVVTVSDFVKRSVVESGLKAEADVFAVWNAVDAEEFDPAVVTPGGFRRSVGVSERAPFVGIVGRMTPWKGHRDLIEALSGVREALPDVKLAIVGHRQGGEGDSLAEQLRAAIRERGLDANVLWIDWTDGIREILADLDVLAAPSWEEPFGLIVTEALAMQRPVVGYASGALPEIFTDGVEGRLVPPRDIPALTAALVDILKAGPRAAEMGRLGRASVLERFTPRRQAAEVEAVYRAVIAAREGGKSL